MWRKAIASNFEVSFENTLPFAALLLLFSFWGLLLSFDDLLSVLMRGRLHMSYRAALLLQASFFLVCFLSAPLVSRIIEKRGYRRSVTGGLCLMGLGCLIMAIGASGRNWSVCLLASGTLGLGINLMQTAAAPLIIHMGSPSLGSRRFSFALAFNSLGTAVGPMLGAWWFQQQGLNGPPRGAPGAGGLDLLPCSYVGVACCLGALAWIAARLRIAELPEEASMHRGVRRGSWMALATRFSLSLGAAAMFLYVGAEIGIGALLVPFEHQAGFSMSSATRLVALYWGGAMLGRFLFVPLLRRPRDLRLMGASAATAAVLVLLSTYGRGHATAWALLPVGLCNSMIVPVLYERSIANLGALTARAAAVMSSMGIGGAAIPQLIAWTADHTNLQHAIAFLSVNYIVITIYALCYTRLARPLLAAAEFSQ